MKALRLNPTTLFSSSWPGWGRYVGDFDLNSQEWQGEGIILTHDKAWLVCCDSGKVTNLVPISAIDQPPDLTKISLGTLIDAPHLDLQATNAASSESTEKGVDDQHVHNGSMLDVAGTEALIANDSALVDAAHASSSAQGGLDPSAELVSSENVHLDAEPQLETRPKRAGKARRKKRKASAQPNVGEAQATVAKATAKVQTRTVQIQTKTNVKAVATQVKSQTTAKERGVQAQLNVRTRSVQIQTSTHGLVKNASTQGRPKQRDVHVQVNIQQNDQAQQDTRLQHYVKGNISGQRTCTQEVPSGLDGPPGSEQPQLVSRPIQILDSEGIDQSNILSAGELDACPEPVSIPKGDGIRIGASSDSAVEERGRRLEGFDARLEVFQEIQQLGDQVSD